MSDGHGLNIRVREWLKGHDSYISDAQAGTFVR